MLSFPLERETLSIELSKLILSHTLVTPSTLVFMCNSNSNYGRFGNFLMVKILSLKQIVAMQMKLGGNFGRMLGCLDKHGLALIVTPLLGSYIAYKLQYALIKMELH